MRQTPPPFGPDADLASCRALGIAMAVTLILVICVGTLVAWDAAL